MRDELIKQLNDYIPFNFQEEKDKKIIIDLLKNSSDIFLRSNRINHMTASAWVLNKSHDKILMCYHNIYNSYSWLGGHADGQEDLLAVAIREVKEESGISDVKPISDDIFSLEILTVDGHEKKGEYVNSHLHVNITYLLEADDSESLMVKADENSDVCWFGIDEAVSASGEPWFRKRIYSKLNSKLRKLEIVK